MEMTPPPPAPNPSVPPRPTRHWPRRVGIGAAVAVLLGVGGPYLYIHLIEGPPPARLSVSAPRAATTPPLVSDGPAPELAGTYRVGTGSVAGYRVGEVLFGQSATAVGRTSAVTGTMTITGTSVTSAAFTVDLTTVKSDRSQRDGQFRGRIMDTSTYPTATFTLTAPISLGSVPPDGTTVTENATGMLGLHGVTKTVTFPVTGKRSGTTISVSGAVPIVFADYHIDNPSGGPATTQDHGTLEFLLDLTHT